MREVERIIAVGVVVSSDEKVIFGQRKQKEGSLTKGVYSDGFWLLPGGGKEDNETIEDAFYREMGEEIGMDLRDTAIELIDDTGNGRSEKTLSDGEKVMALMKFHVYRAKLKKSSQELPLCAPPDSDLPVLRWIDPSELKNLKIIPAAIELFKKLGYLKRMGPSELSTT